MSYEAQSVRGTPHGAPLVPTFPLQMRNTEILTVVYRTRADAVDALVPQPLRSTSDLVAVHLYRMHDADWFGVYGESAVHLPVEHEASGTRGVLSPFLFVEGDGPIAAGREIYGQPKKGGEVELGPNGDLLVGRLRRNGIDVLTATMPWKQRRGDADSLTEHIDFRTNINLKVIADVAGGAALRQITARSFADVTVHEVWTGAGTLELRPNAQAPLHMLPVEDVLAAYHWRVDFTLVDGVVLETLDA